MPSRIGHAEEGWSQNKQRSPAVFYDQHKDSAYTLPNGEKPFGNGRPWWCYVERPADGASMPMPVGPLTPMGWTAPWQPDDKFIVRSIGKVRSDGSIIMGAGLYEQRFRIDYQAMIAEYTQAMRAYYRKAVLEAAALNQPGPDYGGAIGYQLRMRIGDPPRSPKIPEAALAGNKWLLGQLPPVFNSRTQRWEVEEDEQLARLLHSGDIRIETADQSVAKQASIADLQQQLDEFKKLLAQQPAARHERAAPSGKAGAYQQFVKEQSALGLDMKAIGALWREQKAASATV